MKPDEHQEAWKSLVANHPTVATALISLRLEVSPEVANRIDQTVAAALFKADKKTKAGFDPNKYEWYDPPCPHHIPCASDCQPRVLRRKRS